MNSGNMNEEGEDEEEDEENDKESDLALQIMGGSKCTNTRVQYARKIVHFSDWMYEKHSNCCNADRKVILTSVTKKILKQFLGHICKKKDKNGAYLNPIVFHAFQHVSGYKSAIKDLYLNQEVEVSSDINKMLKSFFDGYVRKVAQLKLNGKMPLIEGKMPMGFKGYRFLSSKAIEQEKDHSLSIFAHLFLLLCWNLIARCVSVGSLMYHHISWDNDSLVVVFPAHKGDQEGRTALPKHVYANPSEPAICPILSLAVYIFTKGYEREGSKATVFAGEAESRFSKWLSNICQKHNEVLKSQGVDISMIGTHSFRKGIASFLSGTPGGPTAISIYLRAGWSLGLQSRYILEGEGGDQLCGRAATGLPLTDVTFANLPPHFIGPTLTTAQWEEILPGYSTFFPLNFREVIPFLLASLVYHQPYLADLQTKNPRHPLFQQRVWTSGTLIRLKDEVSAGCNRNPLTKMSATGVPPHLILANAMTGMQKDMVLLREEVIVKIDGLPEALKLCMLENFQINGAVPMTRQDMADLMRDSLAEMRTSLVDLFRQSAPPAPSLPGSVGAPAGAPSETPQYLSWMWNGKFHPVPSDFRFPM